VQPGFSRRKIDSEQSTEIREKFRAAREENPDIPKAVFARTVAPDYGVSAATIVKIITNV
jgi:hypothetical protein